MTTFTPFWKLYNFLWKNWSEWQRKNQQLLICFLSAYDFFSAFDTIGWNPFWRNIFILTFDAHHMVSRNSNSDFFWDESLKQTLEFGIREIMCWAAQSICVLSKYCYNNSGLSCSLDPTTKFGIRWKILWTADFL